MSVFSWVARHGRAVQFGSLGAALVLLVGGMWLGMSQAAGSAAPPVLPAGGDVARAAPITPTKHYVIGTVADVLTPTRAILRTNAGRFVVVESDGSTIVRRKGNIPAMRRGTRVIILGTPRQGRFFAEIVTITGQAPARAEPLPASPPARTPARAPGAATPAVATRAPASGLPAKATPKVSPLAPTPAQPAQPQSPAQGLPAPQTFLAASESSAPAVRAAPAAAATPTPWARTKPRVASTPAALSTAVRAPTAPVHPAAAAAHPPRPVVTAPPTRALKRLQHQASLPKPKPEVAVPRPLSTISGLDPGH